jgi:hypothetical protein
MFKFEQLISPDNHTAIWSCDYTLEEYLHHLAYTGVTKDSTFNGLTAKWVNEFDWSEKYYIETVTLIYEFSTDDEVVYLAIGGTYGSLNGLEMDDDYVEVFPKQVMTTIYTTIDGVSVL